ncbi:hypothetical protein LJC33_07970 [Eubacteriales bacterium OttesenSCG-928-N13]|nr:hypothetical protein [Eubacteriales bacterium OttesenSCG-928-N13]
MAVVMSMTPIGVHALSDLDIQDRPGTVYDVRVPLREEFFIGYWILCPYTCEYYGNSLRFYEDGAFEFYIGADSLYPRGRYRGTWSIEDDKLCTAITSVLAHEGGAIVYDNMFGFHHYYNDVKVVESSIDPPVKETYDLLDLHVFSVEEALRSLDGSDYYHYSSYRDNHRYCYDEELLLLTAHFGGTQYWKMSDNPADGYDDDEEE